jgi:hypothetical protein
MNRFFSTSAEPTSLVGTSWNEIIYEIRNTTMDISIMPWKNMKDVSNLVWMGELYNMYLLNLQDAGRYGVTLSIS